jgi:hypothetical protein
MVLRISSSNLRPGEGLAEGKAMKLLVNTCTIGVPFVDEIEQAMPARGVTVHQRDHRPDALHRSRIARNHD